jgi:hypothetical protein
VHQPVTPERAARLTALVQQCRPLLDQDEGMDAVQRRLHDLGTGVMDSILVTRELLGAGRGNFGQAKTIVLTSPGRTPTCGHNSNSWTRWNVRRT